jgi:hypothetical protein
VGFDLTTLVVIGTDCTDSLNPTTIWSRPRRSTPLNQTKPNLQTMIYMHKIQYYWNKRYINTGKFFCLNNNVSNLYNNGVVERIDGMACNPTTTLKLIYWFKYHQSIVH